MDAVSWLALRNKFVECRAHVAVVGLGYVGLPLTLSLCEAGYTVLGLDIDETKVARLNAGESYIEHVNGGRARKFISSGSLHATTDFAEIAGVDAILICVPTPLTRQREPDLSYVLNTGRAIAPYLRGGRLVVLESTTYPGTTMGELKPILEATGRKSGQDFLLAYSPEREDPGNKRHSVGSIPKVVGGDGEIATTVACALYDRICGGAVPVSSVDVAEAVKLTENIFRTVNIALVNELKMIYAAMGIDVWEVIEAAKTKPFGYMPFYPGPGLGGHCIPIDPFYLSWKAREYDMPARFIELAGEINTSLPHYVVERMTEAMTAQLGKCLRGSRIVLLGFSYKKNVGDPRESPAFKLTALLEARGATVEYYDPHMPEILPSRDHPELTGRESLDWGTVVRGGFDAALICTDHDGVDYAALVDALPLVVDARNATRHVSCDREKIVLA